MEFADRVVIVTGASSGIGRGTALAFAKHGCSLTLTGRNVEHLNTVASLCKSNGAKDVLTVVAEFENMDDVESVVTKTVERFKEIHILVNNAGLVHINNLEAATMDEFDRTFNVNVKSMVRITQQAMPYLVQTKGNVINVSSYFAEKQRPDSLFYVMSKAAVNQFTKTIALEYAPKGVRVNAINPCLVRSALFRHENLTDEQYGGFCKTFEESIPMGRLGEVEECANAILFLVSKQSSWTTGQCMVLDGGMGLV